MSSRRKKQDRKKRRRAQNRGHPQKHPLLGRDVGVIMNPPGEAKMSEVLLEFLQPYSDSWETEDQLRKLLTVGILAWNAGLYSGKERADLVDELVGSVPPAARQDMRTVLAELIRKKETLYAHNRRVIVDYQLTMAPDGPHLVVLSTFPDKEGSG